MLNRRLLRNPYVWLLVIALVNLLGGEIRAWLSPGQESLLHRLPTMALVEVNFIACCLGSAVFFLWVLKPRLRELLIVVTLGLVFEYYISGFRSYIGRCAIEPYFMLGPGLFAFSLLYAMIRLCRAAISGDKESVLRHLEILGLGLVMPVCFGVSGGLSSLKDDGLVYDGMLFASDYALFGTQPSFIITKFLMSNVVVDSLLSVVYDYLAIWMLLSEVLMYSRWRNSNGEYKRRFFPMLTYGFVMIVGILYYRYFPAVGPKAFCGTGMFPNGPYPDPTAMIRPVLAPPFLSRNSMPSLHLTWILCAFLPVCAWNKKTLYIGFSLVVLTLLGAFSVGSHWFCDFVVAFPFTVMCMGITVLRLGRLKRCVAVLWGLLTSLGMMYIIKNFALLLLRCSVEFAVSAVVVDLISIWLLYLIVHDGQEQTECLAAAKITQEGCA